jgi:hypothetical protein
MSTEAERRFPGPLRGQILFAIGFFVISAILLSQIGDQTKWVAKTKFAAQPRFWPAVGLGGMVLFGALHVLHLPRRRIIRDDKLEARKWATVFEWVLWFLAYVWLVPIIGYLPVTMAFTTALAWRAGYRSPRMLWTAAGVGAGIVILFKSILNVKIPGSMLYEFFPGALRSFFILNF